MPGPQPAAPAPRAWRVAINPTRRHSDWWDAARASLHAPAGVQAMLEVFGPEQVWVSGQEAVGIAEWAAEIPGWNDGRHPLIIELDQGEADAASG